MNGLETSRGCSRMADSCSSLLQPAPARPRYVGLWITALAMSVPGRAAQQKGEKCIVETMEN